MLTPLILCLFSFGLKVSLLNTTSLTLQFCSFKVDCEIFLLIGCEFWTAPKMTGCRGMFYSYNICSFCLPSSWDAKLDCGKLKSAAVNCENFVPFTVELLVNWKIVGCALETSGVSIFVGLFLEKLYLGVHYFDQDLCNSINTFDNHLPNILTNKVDNHIHQIKLSLLPWWPIVIFNIISIKLFMFAKHVV